MRVAIDAAGRVIIPKPIRQELGIAGPAELELTAAGGFVELSVPEVEARVEERDGEAVIVPERELPPLTVDAARDAVDRTRR